MSTFLYIFIQAQLASLMALSTQGGEVPLRLFAEHQAAFSTIFFFFSFDRIQVYDKTFEVF